MKYGSYVSKEGVNIVFDKCGISRMIIVTAISADGESSHLILSLDDFLPFMTIPNFRDLNEKNIIYTQLASSGCWITLMLRTSCTTLLVTIASRMFKIIFRRFLLVMYF